VDYQDAAAESGRSSTSATTEEAVRLAMDKHPAGRPTRCTHGTINSVAPLPVNSIETIYQGRGRDVSVPRSHWLCLLADQ
jgi:hypothetical protein